MALPRTYPEGVPSWIDLTTGDADATATFYAHLFGWTFEQVTPPDLPFRYLIGRLGGQDVGAVGSPADRPGWTTYIAVEDAEGAARRVVESGGSILDEPTDVGPGGDSGRSVVCADPTGIRFGLWQARKRLGVQVVNTPVSWNFSDLHTDEPHLVVPFYQQVFGWSIEKTWGDATLIRRPGYGDHLAATSDPEIHARQAGVNAPPGFADAVAWVAAVGAEGSPGWHVSFTVADRDDIVARAVDLGATVVDSKDTGWTREAMIRDPQGAVFTASQFAPPEH